MGARGPAAKPTALRVLEGNRGHRPINQNEPKPRPITPTRPGWLLPEAKREWSRVVPELDRMGLLTIVDRAALTGYCQAWARYVEAEKEIQEHGTVLKVAKSGYVQTSPYVVNARRNLQIIRVFCQEFGLTPSARGRMNIAVDTDDDMGGLLD